MAIWFFGTRLWAGFTWPIFTFTNIKQSSLQCFSDFLSKQGNNNFLLKTKQNRKSDTFLNFFFSIFCLLLLSTFSFWCLLFCFTLTLDALSNRHYRIARTLGLGRRTLERFFSGFQFPIFFFLGSSWLLLSALASVWKAHSLTKHESLGVSGSFPDSYLALFCQTCLQANAEIEEDESEWDDWKRSNQAQQKSRYS